VWRSGESARLTTYVAQKLVERLFRVKHFAQQIQQAQHCCDGFATCIKKMNQLYSRAQIFKMADVVQSKSSSSDNNNNNNNILEKR
jgi:hypothetical protein